MRIINKDITKFIKFDPYDVDGEMLPITKCICGETFESWDFILHIDDGGDLGECPNCGRKMFFETNIRIFERREI